MILRGTSCLLLIWFTIAVALLASLIKMPESMAAYIPNYVVMVLLYWVMATPEKVNVGTGWITGLFMDLLLGSTLGIHAALMAFVVWMVAGMFSNSRYYSLIQKTIVVGTVNFIGQFLFYWVEHIFGLVSVNYDNLWSGFATVILWPVTYVILNFLYSTVKPHERYVDYE